MVGHVLRFTELRLSQETDDGAISLNTVTPRASPRSQNCISTINEPSHYVDIHSSKLIRHLATVFTRFDISRAVSEQLCSLTSR